MDASTLSIALAYGVLIAAIAFALSWSKVSWKRKVPVVVIAPLFTLVLWYGIGSHGGWPTKQGLPDDCLVQGAVVREPSRASGDPGRIYVWAIPLEEDEPEPGVFRYRPMKGEPRGYSLPYERQLHEAVERARQLAAKGRPAMLSRRKSEETTGSGNRFSDEQGDGYIVRDAVPSSEPAKRP